jgi:hypothetical protein
MPTAPRYYLIADDGKIHRLARNTFYKLLEQKIPAPLPEFNGKRVKLATVNVRLDGRRAIAVARASYTFITFDANGFFDSTEWDAATEATIETWTVPTLPSSSPFIDARARFADRRYELEQTWQPSDDLRRQLFANATAGRATYH